jgi:hypothetical protein
MENVRQMCVMLGHARCSTARYWLRRRRAMIPAASFDRRLFGARWAAQRVTVSMSPARFAARRTARRSDLRG